MPVKEFGRSVTLKIIELMIASFGMLAALSYNTTFMIYYEKWKFNDPWLLPVVVTIIVVFATLILGYMANKIKKKEIKEIAKVEEEIKNCPSKLYEDDLKELTKEQADIELDKSKNPGCKDLAIELRKRFDEIQKKEKK